MMSHSVPKKQASLDKLFAGTVRLLRLQRGARNFFICLVIALLVTASLNAQAGTCDPVAGVRKVYVHDYKAMGDGKTDDGPAIRAALKAVLNGSKPASLEFDKGKTYRITSFDDTYALRVLNTQRVTVHGNGAELLLLPPNKVLRLSDSSDVNICGLMIDYSPLPFTQGMVVSTNASNSTFEIEIEEGFDVPEIDRDTVRDNSSVWEFAMPYKQDGEFEKRVNIKTVHASTSKRRVQIVPHDTLQWQHMIPGRTHLVMPVPGKGQTGNFAFQIINNERIHIEDISVYAVPKFTFHVAENHGKVDFVNVEQRKRPGTSRAMTGWRDVFHVKDNRASVRWDGCYIEGAFDDAFNLSAMYQLVIKQLGPQSWRLRNAGLGDAPVYKSGDRLQAIDIAPERRLIGEAKIVSLSQRGKETDITLSSPLALKAVQDGCQSDDEMCGSRIVNLDAANEGSVIRNCNVSGSMRLRSKTIFEHSKFKGFLQIANSPTKEGPLPADVIVQDCELSGTVRIGADANTKTSIQDWSYGERWAKGIIFRNNRIESVFKAQGASIDLFENEVVWPKARKFEFKNCGPINIRDLSVNGKKLPNPIDRVSLGQNMTEKDVLTK